MPLHAAPGNVMRFLTDLYGTFELKAWECQVDYSLAVPAEPLELYFDRSKLEIILTNLLANAFTYTHSQGQVELGVTVVGSPARPVRSHMMPIKYL